MEFIIGIVLLVIAIWALINLWQSGASTGQKIL